jgi:hypothetical protein
MSKTQIAIIGSGATAIYLLKHLCDNFMLLEEIENITIFEKSGKLGMGMPYNPETTDIYNLANISSEEIPELPETFGNWARALSDSELKTLNITELHIKDSEVYSRVALGRYLNSQYTKLIAKLKSYNLIINEISKNEVVDIEAVGDGSGYNLYCSDKKMYPFSKVIIATGHCWNEEDIPKKGYYASPWPIHKILPRKNSFYNFTIGTLGASLSAFDVVTSLAHRHGKFIETTTGLQFEKNIEAPNFRMVMHSAEGWLPHLQYEQKNTMREIYRHTNRESILALIDADGFISLEEYYTKICKPELIIALKKDGKPKIVAQLEQSFSSFKDFVKIMSETHQYTDSFEGMKKEMIAAKESVEGNKPIYWKETLDDLMYCLNFHSELLSAEDHLFFRKEVMPFLMNVIAALPLSSANILIALHEADCIALVVGRVKILEDRKFSNKTEIEVEDKEGIIKNLDYDLFVNCAGQKNIELEDYPFPSMVVNGLVRKSRAKFATIHKLPELKKSMPDKIFTQDKDAYLFTGGIDVDAAYRIIAKNGEVNKNIYDISFTHTSGSRPYSYGLQACSATSKILVNGWKMEMKRSHGLNSNIKSITKMYKNDADL